MRAFSVVLATHNEVQNLKRCIHSVQSLADEVIVVDGESSDGTGALATSLGTRVISTTNKSNFHINKQLAMDEAQGSLILQLDADEVVDGEFLTFMQGLKTQQAHNQLPGQPAAWSIRRKNYFLGRWLSKGGQYPDAVIRLYQQGKARLPQQNVHEQMVVDGEVAVAQGHLLHYPNPTFESYMVKFNRYTSFEAQRLYSRGVRASTGMALRYFFWKPLATWFSLYLRHRGYVDGMAGFIFALMSGLHHPLVALKLHELELTAAKARSDNASYQGYDTMV